MTERVYQRDNYRKEISANIVKVEGNNIILDKTIFYPESGGQSADRGFIDSYRVTNVRNSGNEIIHILDRPFMLPVTNKKVQLKIDWEHRYGNMQQHTGQHLLSAVFLELLNAETVSSHLGAEENTVDISAAVELNDEAIRRVELYANSLIYKKIPIKSYFPSVDELEKLNLRRKPKVNENIRVVEIEGIDVTPCGGTHLTNTAEIAIIKIIKAEKYKSMYRVHFLCGSKAFMNYLNNYTILSTTAKLLSAPLKEIPLRTSYLIEKSKTQSRIINSLKSKLIELKIASILENKEKINSFNFFYEVSYIETSTDDTLILKQKEIFKQLKNVPFNSIFLLLEVNNKKDPKEISVTIRVFQFNNDLKIDALFLLNSLISNYNGKGGGSDKSAHGIITVQNKTPKPEIIVKIIKSLIKQL